MNLPAKICRRFRLPQQVSFALLLLLALLLLGSPTFQIPIAIAAETPSPSSSTTECAEKPVFVTLDGRNVLEMRATTGAQNLEDVARRESSELLALAKDRTVAVNQIVVRDSPPYALIGIEDSSGEFEQLGAVDDRMAACSASTRMRLAETYRDSLKTAISRYRKENSAQFWLRGSALAALVLAAYVVWLRVQFRLNNRIRDWLSSRERFVLQRLSRVGITALVDADRVRQLMQLIRVVIHWTILLLISYLLIPLLLGFFPPTQGIAEGLRAQILGLVVAFLQGMVAAIPNLLSIAVIIGITIVIIRISNAFFNAIRLGRLRIPGFYREWAKPTSRLVATLAVLIALVGAFPFVPGSGSEVFQGAGLFVGVLAALGSSAVATNIISGLMLIYTRAFREGDRIDINGVVGVVQDRTLLVTRVKTPRNELVSIPNATVISSSVTNFSFSRREIRQPVALATTITIGYDVPWRQVHELMLTAARSVEGITDEIEPFVLQTSLNDFHISYELTAYVRDPGTYRQTLSDLFAALQDHFAEAKVEILSPGYHAIRNGNASTLPKQPGNNP
ncbi:mechanosensitive ion channel [Synechococcus sp. BSF8S]|nr:MULTISPECIES: mechanosensitive ion channel domain-containing protein [unclassified Synechococcus]MBC1260578.1 mechanosensitive ion channel [Synechococcus sp. BSF8S]MBC1263229.1 mechanosensitive ion channel [Synechococcus sp. BSA11S]